MSDVLHLASELEVSVDDCWNRIGVRGDHSCARLEEYFRCLNCPTFAAGASALLDRPVVAAGAEQQYHSAALAATPTPTLTRSRDDNSASMLVFRVGDEWLGLATATIVEVIEARAIHSLPHQANPAVLGLTNIRGALTLCVSLSRMLAIGNATHAGQRLLVVMHEEQVLAFPVDEVAGVHVYTADTAQPPPSTVAQTGSSYTAQLIAWRQQQVGLLDCGLLFYALNRSLT